MRKVHEKTLKRNIEKNNKKRILFLRDIFLLVLASFMFLFSHPNFIFKQGLGILGFVQMVPVFFVLKRSSGKVAWLYGFFYGILCYGLLCYWFAVFHVYTFFLGIPAIGVILAMVFEAMYFLSAVSKKYGYYLMGLLWLVYEYLKTKGFLGFPYGVLGYTQWNNTLFLQSSSFAGVWWLSLVCVFSSAIMVDLLESFSRRDLTQFFKQKTIPVLSFLSILIFTVFFGIVSLNRKSYGTKEFKILSVQNNTDSNKYGLDVYRKDVNTLMKLTQDALDGNQDVDFVVWPETAVVPPVMYHYEKKTDERRVGLIESLFDFFETHDSCFVFGNQMTVDLGNKYLDDFNAALVFDKESGNIRPPNPDVYYKIHLVPLQESFPYEKIFPRLYKKLLMGDTHLWTAGTEYKVFDQRGLKFSTPICFEDCFGELCRTFVKNGAQCFFNLTNDSWSKSPACQMQHLSMAVFRSVENSVPTVRSTGSGATCFIDKNGRVYGKTNFFEENYSLQTIEIPQDSRKTFYSRFGDWLPFLEILSLIVLAILFAAKKLMRNSQGHL